MNTYIAPMEETHRAEVLIPNISLSYLSCKLFPRFWKCLCCSRWTFKNGGLAQIKECCVL